MNAQHSAIKTEHYTPAAICHAARELMNGIDLDPASDEQGNSIIQATEYFTEDDDSLNRPWEGRVFLNPPGGKIGNKSLQCLFWDKLYGSWVMNQVTEAVFIGFSLEILSKRGTEILKMPFCIPQPCFHPCVSGSGRIKFMEWRDGVMQSQSSPTHGNVIVYLPPWGNHWGQDEIYYKKRKFQQIFSQFGEVVIAQ